MKAYSVKMFKNLILFLFISLAVSSCASAPESKKEGIVLYTAADKEASSDVEMVEVYLNDGRNLSSVELPVIEGSSFASILYYLEKGMPEQDLYNTIANIDVIDEISLENDTLNIYFSDKYKELAPMEDILLRSSIVKSFTSLDEVSYVAFYLDNIPLKSSNNSAVGKYSADDIAYSNEIISDLVYYEEHTIYYPKADALQAVLEEMEIGMNDNICDEIVAMLMTVSEKNPEPAIPAGTKVISSNIVDGVCFLDLSEEFLNNNAGDLSDNLAIFSIVNSLTSLPDVTKVQFFIEGEKVDLLRGENYLYEEFEFNHKIVIK